MWFLSILTAVATAPDPTNTAVTITAISALLGTFATAVYTIWNIKFKSKKQKVSEEVSGRSITFDEMESAIPGLGSLVDRWQKQAETAWGEIEKLKTREATDGQKIQELERQVRELTADLRAEKAKNMQLENRVKELEGRGTS